LVDELVEVLDSAGLPLKPRLRLTPSVVRVLVREDLVRAPRGNQEWVSVRIRTGIAIASIYACMRRGQQRDRLPRALDNSTTRLDGLTIRHAWPAGEWHPWAPENMTEPPAEA